MTSVPQKPAMWRRVHVADVCETVSVGIVIQPSRYYVAPGQGIRAFRSANVGESRIVDRDWVYLSPEGHRANSKSSLKAGDVLVVRSGAPGTACVVTEEYAGSNCIDIVFARPHQDQILPEYLAEFTNSPVGRRHVLGTQGGLALKHFNVGAYKQLQLLVPDVAEQKTIVSLFGLWDTAIQKVEQLIAAKERHYKHELLRHINFSRYPHADAGVIAEKDLSRNRGGIWRIVSLSAISRRVQRQGDGGNYQLLTISSASGFIRQEDRYSRYMAGESAKKYTLLRAGEFSYNKGNSKRYEFGCVFQLQHFDAALVPSVYVSFKLDDSVCSSYMRHLFAADYLKPQLRSLVRTGVRNNGLLNIRPDEFMSTKVPLPPFERQVRIANYLDAANAEIDLLKQQLIALRAQKRGLMQRLLSGQWRLPIQEETS